MATYNVGPSGAYATLQACLAAGVLAPGDTIQLESGYDVDEYAGLGVSWVDNITLQGDVNDPSNAICRWSNGASATYQRALYVHSINNWTIKGITFKYTGPVTTGSGAIYIHSSASGVTVEDCVVESTVNGLSTFGHLATIRRVKADGSASGINTGAGIVDGGSDNSTIESCLAYNWGGFGIQADLNTTINNCTVYNDKPDVLNSTNVTGIFADKGSSASTQTQINNCVVYMNCTKAGARGIRINNGYRVFIRNTITYGTPGGDANDLSAGGSAPTETNVTKSSGVGASAVLVDAPNDDFYPADPGLALHTGDATYAPAGGDLNQQSFDSPPSMGCLEAVPASGGGGGAVMKSRAHFLPSPLTLNP
tara:strand:+ start:649 stop:1746 length:1098 start_codon:yes stop_codon:yes gene_type:complete